MAPKADELREALRLQYRIGELSARHSVDQRKWVYRLWAEDGTCLYVGQHVGLHPAVRVYQHRDKSWWHEVSGFDFVEVLDGDLDRAEEAQILDLAPEYNRNYAQSMQRDGISRAELKDLLELSMDHPELAEIMHRYGYPVPGVVPELAAGA
jgi:hypothetical protein